MKKREVLAKQVIGERVRELGRMISRDYKGGRLVLVGVLNGAFVFLADLARAIDLDVEIDFIRVASYGKGSSSSGRIFLTKDIEVDLSGKHVLLVEDIIDTGRTISYLKDYFRDRDARSVKVCTLIDKKERRVVAVDADYLGFEIDDGFLVGYGLDYAEHFRNLEGIFHLEDPEAIV